MFAGALVTLCRIIQNLILQACVPGLLARFSDSVDDATVGTLGRYPFEYQFEVLIGLAGNQVYRACLRVASQSPFLDAPSLIRETLLSLASECFDRSPIKNGFPFIACEV